MKVYIKPWEEALECAKKANKKFVDKYTGNFYILNISRRAGDWGRIVEAIKEENYYTSDIDRYPFTYPACCVEKITPDWLEKHASKFGEEVFVTDTWDKNFENYETHRITIYKAVDGMHAYFFYVKRVSYNGCEETVEDFREIN